MSRILLTVGVAVRIQKNLLSIFLMMIYASDCGFFNCTYPSHSVTHGPAEASAGPDQAALAPNRCLCAFLARRSASRLFTALNYSRIEALVNAVMGRTGERTTSSFFIRKNCGIISSATVNQVTGRTFWYDSLWADGYSTSRYANDIDRLCKFYKSTRASDHLIRVIR
ncbi:hypothetical protein LY78DRAFT_78681 [Colletotrichum sublineola]|nr:hypothetical protein LY78DRAFT_78681 [Colletotrichum sublineola]